MWFNVYKYDNNKVIKILKGPESVNQRLKFISNSILIKNTYYISLFHLIIYNFKVKNIVFNNLKLMEKYYFLNIFPKIYEINYSEKYCIQEYIKPEKPKYDNTLELKLFKENSIILMKKYNIYLSDLLSGNIIYNNKKYIIIDCDLIKYNSLSYFILKIFQ